LSGEWELGSRGEVGGGVAAEDLSELGHGGEGLEARHEAIDLEGGVLPGKRGEVGIDLGGGGEGVAEACLDGGEVDAGFEEVGGVGMAEGMDGGMFTDAGVLESEAEGGLDAADGEGTVDGGHGRRAEGGRGEEPAGVAMGLPEGAKHMEGVGREGDIAILAPLTVADMDEAAGTIDIREAERDGLTDTQAAGIDGSEARAVPGRFDEGEEPLDFVEGEDDGEGLLAGRFDQVEDLPLATEGGGVEELDARDEDGHGTACGMLVVDQEEEEVADLVFGEEVRSAVVVFGELVDGPDIAQVHLCSGGNRRF